MLMKLHKSIDGEKGSATIEAVVAFVGFLFTIFTILGLVNFCRAQMLVSSAVDTATREMSQYAYFYKMSGLQKFDENVSGQASVGKDNINEIIGTVDTLYSSLGGAVDGTSEDMANLADVTSKGDLQLQDIETVITNIETNGSNIANSIASMGNALERVGDDPLLYMRSLVAIAGEEGMDLAKRAIASSLAKLFVQKHFGDSRTEANDALERLGIEGGLDNMNFNLSTMFTDEDKEDIEIVVFYKVKLIQIFDWELFEVNLSKRAVCRAWLGGDNVQEYVDPTQSGSLSGDDVTNEGNEGQTDETETTDPTEGTTEPTEEKVDTTGSYWHLGVDRHGYDNTAASFDNLLVSSKGIDREEMVVNGLVYGRDRYNVVYGMDFCVDADDVYSNLIYWDSMQAIKAMEDAYVESGGTKGYEPGTTNTYKYVIYVPENIPDEKLEAIKKASEENKQAYTAAAQEDYGLDISVSVEIVKAGGNYDYSNGG